MKARTVANGVQLLGAVDWDRRLFDALIPLPDGTSYNAYLVQGSQATALLDTVNPPQAETLLGQLASLTRLDYIVAHHAEQDHSGTLPLLLAKYPEARVLCSAKARGMLIDLLEVPADRLQAVADGEKVSLGNKTLEFLHTPWQHWPETIMSYLPEDRVLFSCDLFGSHLATSDVFADEERVYEPAKRYFAEIMMPFRNIVEHNMEKVAGRDVAIIAPSHGPLYRRPRFIQDAYREWVAGGTKNLVALPYVSMHDSTRVMVDYLVSALVERGVGVAQFDLTATDPGKLAISLVDATTIVLGTPTVLTGPHPAAAAAAFLINALRAKARFLAVIGSYGWGGKTVEVLTAMLGNLKVETLPAVLAKGLPKAAEYAALDQLADAIASRHAAMAGNGTASA
ncbi:MAG: FprA family A-type flavoprotein [Chloroflexi bacterium]|nr:FprA family A-type flavoprotein [Chloroflexota bacterium]